MLLTRKHLAADLMLLACAAIWGATFVAQKMGAESMHAVSFVAMRFGLGGLLVAALLPMRSVLGFRGNIIDPTRGHRARDLWLGGSLAGVAMLGAALTQQIGVAQTSTGNAGFITSLYVVGVPLIGIALGQRPGWAAWVAVLIAVPGLYLLSVSGRPHIEPGDLWILACAACWAVHVQVVGRFAPRCDPIALSAVQFLVTGLGAAVVSLCVQENPLWHGAQEALLPILACAIFATGLCFTMQTIAQRDAPPTHTAIILSLEGIFAVLTGWLVLSEVLTAVQWIGAAILLGAALLAQVPGPTENRRPQT
ncbi:MAG: DMT family transporter [Planctomycetota bacterium]|nr:DMT family transporter [Planctomycetota bacterium]MDA1105363.1 DMT family transporter [Planctomycetota bacterium]